MSQFQESTLLRVNQINDSIYSRNVPTSELKPSFNLRPVSTKYSTFPILDQRAKPTEELKTYPNFSTEDVFNPGNASAPWNGFSANINTESDLRNQYFALQKADRAVFVPHSSSELYNVNVVGQNIEQTHQMLFNQESFNEFNPNLFNLGKESFNNFTRIQLKNLK